MAVKAEPSDEGKCIKITITREFDARDYDAFKSAFSQYADQVCYEIELSGVTLMDSSALGMLLHLREYALGQGSTVVLTNPSDMVLRNLERAHFQELFEIRT